MTPHSDNIFIMCALTKALRINSSYDERVTNYTMDKCETVRSECSSCELACNDTANLNKFCFKQVLSDYFEQATFIQSKTFIEEAKDDIVKKLGRGR